MSKHEADRILGKNAPSVEPDSDLDGIEEYGIPAIGKSDEDIAFERNLRDLKLQKAAIENELLTYQLEELRLKKARRSTTHLQHEKDLNDQIRSQEYRSSRCNHRKGGKGMAAIQGRGQDAQYCVIKHTLPTNEMFVFCTRCPKIWKPEPNDPIKQMQYLTACEFPTDNEPSGSTIWQFRRNNGSQDPVRWGIEETEGEILAT